jgi:hypothetical protein
VCPQPIVLVYVDNAESTAAVWRKILGDKLIVKQDPWHLQQRLTRPLDHQHPAYESFRGGISRAIFTLCAEDSNAAEVLDAPGVPAKVKMIKWKQCMKSIPAGSIVWDRLLQLYLQYQAKFPEFITQEAMTALYQQQDLIMSGYLTDPFPVKDMYYTDATGKLRSHRSESQSENVHSR